MSTLDKTTQETQSMVRHGSTPEFDKVIYEKKPYVAPRTRVETTLVKIWAKSLEIEAGEIGINDNFFAFGGNSLAILKVLFLVEEKFGYELPVEEAFQDATIANMSAMISANIKSTCD